MVDVTVGSFAAVLKHYRAVAGLTQEELAERAGVSARAIGSLERGVRQRPYSHTVGRLVQALGLEGEAADHFQRAARGLGEPVQDAGEPVAPGCEGREIPVPPTPFIGRRQEMEEIRTLLAREGVRLLTLTGPGGVGKTRLALQVAGEMAPSFPDGVVFVSLASLADPGLVPAAVAAACGVKEVAGQTLIEHLRNHLRPKHLLLLLDNFEHLLEVGLVLSDLLASCPQLVILVTSRSILHLAAEHEYPVPPLTTPLPGHLPELEALSRYDAVQLFLGRAEAVKPRFILTEENAPAIAAICHRLDGLPLAVELAAARIRLFPPHALLTHLSNRLQLLTGGPRDVPARQQTLRDTIDWSYQLLKPDEQNLFTRLSVFAGGCDLEAAEAVCNPDGGLNLLGTMTSLVDQSLLGQVGEEDLRFTMLETIREYAAERLGQAAHARETKARHAAYYLQLAQRAESRLMGPEQRYWLDRLEAEHDNLRATLRALLDGGQPEPALRLSTALSPFWRFRGYAREGSTWLEEGFHAAVGTSKAEWARGLAAWAQLLWELTELDLVEAYAREALSLFRDLRDRAHIGFCLNLLGMTAFVQAKFEQSRALYEESLTISQETGMEADAARTLGNLGLVAHMEGDYQRAVALLEEAVQRLQELGDQVMSAYFLACLARDLHELGALDRSEIAVREGLKLGRKVGWPATVCAGLASLGDLAIDRGEYEEAAARYDAALHEARASGVVALAVLLLCKLGEVRIEQGESSRAQEVLREALTLTRDYRVYVWLPLTLEILAWLLGRGGEPERATRLCSGAASLRRVQGAPASPSEQARNEKRMAVIQEQIGLPRWTEYWRAGQRRSQVELLHDALEGVDALQV